MCVLLEETGGGEEKRAVKAEYFRRCLLVVPKTIFFQPRTDPFAGAPLLDIRRRQPISARLSGPLHDSDESSQVVEL